MKKQGLLYTVSYLLLIISYPIYGFVSYPNSTSPGSSLFEYTLYNNMVYEVLPLIGAMLLTFFSYFIYFKSLPKKKSYWFLIPEFINLVCDGTLIFMGFFLWKASVNFYGAIIIAFWSIILFIIGIIPVVNHFLKDKKKDEIK